jgi:hypothetical protein
MIPVKYRQLGIALVTKSSSLIRSALPVVTWPSRVGSNITAAAQAPVPAAPSAAPVATAAEDTLARVTEHLEYLGYETGPATPDGWRYAIHPHRYNFHLSTHALGIKLHCAVPIGAAIGNSRGAWLEFLNAANERGQMAQFSLFEDKAGIHRVRMFAFVSGSYNRAVFAMVMDMWHDDLDLVRHKPEFLDKASARGTAGASVTVN